MPTSVDFADSFLKALKRLHKKYQSIRADLQPLIEQLEAGATPGDQIPGVGYPVYKVRLNSSDLQRGKSGGYRVIYFVRVAQHIILLLIYAKSDRENIPADELRQLVQDALNNNESQDD